MFRPRFLAGPGLPLPSRPFGPDFFIGVPSRLVRFAIFFSPPFQFRFEQRNDLFLESLVKFMAGHVPHLEAGHSQPSPEWLRCHEKRRTKFRQLLFHAGNLGQ